MTTESDPREDLQAEEFARHAEARDESQLAEMLAFLKEEKKWFLAPLIFILLLAGVFLVLGGSAAAPFIYALF